MDSALILSLVRDLFAEVVQDELQAAVEAALEKTLPEAIRRARQSEWQSRSSAADYLGVSLRTLDGLRKAKKVAWSKRQGRVMLRTSDLDAYLTEGRVPSKPPITSR